MGREKALNRLADHIEVNAAEAKKCLRQTNENVRAALEHDIPFDAYRYEYLAEWQRKVKKQIEEKEIDHAVTVLQDIRERICNDLLGSDDIVGPSGPWDCNSTSLGARQIAVERANADRKLYQLLGKLLQDLQDDQ